MRSNKEFLEEIYARGQRYKTDRKRRIKAIILSALPPIICVVLIAAIGRNVNDVNLKRKTKSNKKSKAETVSYTEGTGEEEELIVEDTADTELLNDDIDGDYFLEDKGEAAPNKGAAAAPQSSAPSEDRFDSSGYVTSAPNITESKQSTTANDVYLSQQFPPEVLAADSAIISTENNKINITDTTGIKKLRAFIVEAYRAPVSYTVKSIHTLKIEIGGIEYYLRSNLLCDETNSRNYELNSEKIELLKNILDDAGLLDSELEQKLGESINN